MKKVVVVVREKWDGPTRLIRSDEKEIEFKDVSVANNERGELVIIPTEELAPIAVFKEWLYWIKKE